MNSVLLPQLHPSVRLQPAKTAALPFLQSSAVLGAGVVVDKAKAEAYHLEKPTKWLEMLKDRLTFVPKYEGMALEAFKETSHSLIIPRCWPGSTLQDLVSLPKVLSHGTPWPADCGIFRGSLRAEQQEAVTILYSKLKEMPHATLAVMPCGFGKTVVALALAAQVRRRVLVVVHKEFLLSQWRERIATFLPDVQVTVLGGGRSGVPAKRALASNALCTSEIVIALVQSLVRCCESTPSMAQKDKKEKEDTERQILTNIGFMVFDECHHMAARTFSTVFFHIPAQYVLGLSATPTRRDGCTPVLMWHFHDIGYHYQPCASSAQNSAPLCRNAIQVTWTNPKCYVRIGSGSVGASGSSESTQTSQQQLLQITQKMRDALIRDQERNVWLVHCCYALASKGQVLLLSHRREHLQGLLQKFEQLQGATEEATKKYRGALYVGGLTEAQRATASQAHVLFGTYQMAAEGLDIPTLGVLVLATPAGDIEQALGRILRTSPQKTETWVLDVEDEFHQSAGPVAGMLRNWSRQRQRTLRTLDFKTHRAASTEEVLTLLQKPLGQTTLAQANKDMSSDSTATMVEVVDGEDGSMDVDPFDL